jgi:hypothetical protein
VPDGADVYVRLVALELLLGHVCGRFLFLQWRCVARAESGAHIGT